MSLITLFSAPKPFKDPHINIIQRNAIQSWLQLAPEVEVLLVGDEQGMGEVAAEYSIKHLPQVACNAEGTPLISSIFELARQNSDSPLLAYVNGDILLLPDFVSMAQLAMQQTDKFLLVGQRYDLDITEPLVFGPQFARQLRVDAIARGRLHPPGGSDYFIYPRTVFSDIPEFAVGRAGWDNWMFYEARARKWPLIDATESIQIIHQQHDYRHLPNGQPHYRLPESAENIRLAGGEIAIFDLLDSDRRIVAGKIKRPGFSLKKMVREFEILPLTWLHSKKLGWFFYSLFHPVRGYWLIRKKLGKHLKK